MEKKLGRRAPMTQTRKARDSGSRTIKFGYRCEEERYQPSRLLKSAVAADRLGFDFASVADHFHPWFHKEAAAGQAWVLIAAAAAKTSNIRLGTSITAPIFRYHPAIIAQTFATLGEMFPGRIFLGLGSGEAMNEVPLGFRWPKFEGRLQRLKEATTIIQRLWKEEFVSFDGEYFRLKDANLYTKPPLPVPLYLAASGPTIARLAGERADGFIAGAGVTPDASRARELLSIVEKAARDAGRNPDDLRKQIMVHISYDSDHQRAVDALRRWSIQGSDDPALASFFRKEIYDPRMMDRMAAKVDLKEFAKRWLVCTDLEEVVKKVEDAIGAGYNEIELFSVSPDEDAFLQEFGKKHLPYLLERYKGQ